MDKAELLAEFKAQLDLFDKYQGYIDKAKSYAEKFNPAVVEKVITDNTQRIREVADVLDPLVGDVRGVIGELERARADVHKGVATARLKVEELELRKMIGELDDDAFEAETGHLRQAIDSADEQTADIEAEIADFRGTLERWTSRRPEVDYGGAESESDDLLGDVEDEGGVDLDDDEAADEPEADEEDEDLLGESAFSDDGPADEGVHTHQMRLEDDVSAVFGGEEEDVIEAGDGGGIAFDDEELGDLGKDALAEPALDLGPAATADGQATLIMLEGTPEEAFYPLGDEVISVGRGRDNTIQVKNDSKVSRHHCKLSRRGNNFFIEDNKSANGTLVDGELITEKRLIGGEEIIVGETLFRFRIQR